MISCSVWVCLVYLSAAHQQTLGVGGNLDSDAKLQKKRKKHKTQHIKIHKNVTLGVRLYSGVLVHFTDQITGTGFNVNTS